MFSRTVLAAGCLVLAVTLNSGSAFATCTNTKITATGRSDAMIKKFQERRARKRASSNWRSEASSRFGSAFANFGHAKGGTISCRKIVGSGVLKAVHTKCTVSGIPCDANR